MNHCIYCDARIEEEGCCQECYSIETDTDDSIDLSLCIGCQQRPVYIDGMCAQCIDDELDD